MSRLSLWELSDVGAAKCIMHVKICYFNPLLVYSLLSRFYVAWEPMVRCFLWMLGIVGYELFATLQLFHVCIPCPHGDIGYLKCNFQSGEARCMSNSGGYSLHIHTYLFKPIIQ